MGEAGEQGPAGMAERPLFRGPCRGPSPPDEVSRHRTTLPSAQTVTPPLRWAPCDSPGLGGSL